MFIYFVPLIYFEILTLCVGLVKLTYDTRRIRRYGKLTSEPAVALGVSETQIQNDKAECIIPFGVRALESGIEVDGVWVSLPDTPSRSSQHSITSTIDTSMRSATTASNGSSRTFPSLDLPSLTQRPCYPPPWLARSSSEFGASIPMCTPETTTSYSGFTTPRRQSIVPSHSYPAASVLHNSVALAALEGIERQSVDSKIVRHNKCHQSDAD
jgi:hypothetical protein